jgi:hypothetical protein
MKTNLLFCLSFILIPFIGFAQYSIDDHYIEFTDASSVDDFYANTFFNADQALTVEWIIIQDSMPSEWEFSNCFPSCFALGITSGTGSFEASSQQYLNCHFYPNNVAGEGLVKMEITINSSIVDTVTWRGIASDVTDISQWYNNISNPVVAVYNLFGQKIDKIEPNQIHILQYQDGTIRKSLNVR